MILTTILAACAVLALMARATVLLLRDSVRGLDRDEHAELFACGAGVVITLLMYFGLVL